MCDPTYPIVRAGSILKSSRRLEPEEAVKTAALLHDHSAQVTQRAINTIAALSDVTDVQASTDEDAVRIRIQPALTLDFRPIGFAWKGHPMEFRACATVCSGTRKAKLWTRYNFTQIQHSKATVAEYFDWVDRNNDCLHEVCIAFYNEQLAILRPDVSLERTYEVMIKLMSVASPQLKEELDKEFSELMRRSPQQAKDAYDLLIDTIEADCGLSIPNKALGDRTMLVGFRYPRKPTASDVEARDETLAYIDAPALHDDNFGALCIVDYDDSGVRITGLAHEAEPPPDFRRSATHVVSGEISFEVGNAY